MLLAGEENMAVSHPHAVQKYTTSLLLYSLESYNGEILLIEELHVSSISKLITNIRRTKLSGPEYC